MGSTPRERLTQIPLPTRSSEASSECQGRTVLSYLREAEQRPAAFFVLGDILHRHIEYAINNDIDLDDALIRLELDVAYNVEQLRGNPNVVSGMQRSVGSMFADAERMMRNWYAHVHPDSDKRMEIYNDYQWPPRTEVQFYNTRAGTRNPVWGSIDSVFEGKRVSDYSDGSGLLIVDWKSGVKRPPTQFQLDYYRFGAQWRRADAAYHMLDRVRKQSIVLPADPYPGDLEIRDAISLTERMKQATIAGVMPKFSPGWQCGYCTVQHICPVDGDPRRRAQNEKELQRLLNQAEALPELGGITLST